MPLAATISAMTLPLFVPGDRPERFAKAVAAGADAVIVDLEDAVAPEAKAAARAGLAVGLAGLPDIPVLLRVNAADTPWHCDDLAAAAELGLAAIMLPKAERGAGIVAAAAAARCPVVALIETAAGLAAVDDLARASARIAFGSIDFAADLAMGHTRQSLLAARTALVLASRLAGRPAPIDGVTPAIHDAELIAEDCAHAIELGFAGKLLIHPAQIAPARRGFAPTEADVDWAQEVLRAAVDGKVARVGGAMVDAPVLTRARQILARAGA